MIVVPYSSQLWYQLGLLWTVANCWQCYCAWSSLFQIDSRSQIFDSTFLSISRKICSLSAWSSLFQIDSWSQIFDSSFPSISTEICSLSAPRVPLHDQSISWMLQLLYYHQPCQLSTYTFLLSCLCLYSYLYSYTHTYIYYNQVSTSISWMLQLLYDQLYFYITNSSVNTRIFPSQSQ